MTPLAWLVGTLLGGIGIDAVAHMGGPDALLWLWAPTALALLELFLVPSGAWTDSARRGALLVRLLAVAAIAAYWVSAVAAGSIGWGGSAPVAILAQWCVGLTMASRDLAGRFIIRLGVVLIGGLLLCVCGYALLTLPGGVGPLLTAVPELLTGVRTPPALGLIVLLAGLALWIGVLVDLLRGLGGLGGQATGAPNRLADALLGIGLACAGLSLLLLVATAVPVGGPLRLEPLDLVGLALGALGLVGGGLLMRATARLSPAALVLWGLGLAAALPHTRVAVLPRADVRTALDYPLLVGGAVLSGTLAAFLLTGNVVRWWNSLGAEAAAAAREREEAEAESVSIAAVPEGVEGGEGVQVGEVAEALDIPEAIEEVEPAPPVEPLEPAAQAASAHAGPVHAESAHVESAHGESAHVESVQALSAHAESVHAGAQEAPAEPVGASRGGLLGRRPRLPRGPRLTRRSSLPG